MSKVPNDSSVSGKTIIFVLFPLAAVLCLVVFLVGFHEKRMRLAGRPEITAAENSEMRDLLDSLPKEWTRISFVQGQGWVIYSPCGSRPGVLHVATDSSGQMELHCDFCDSLHDARILKVLRFAGGDRLQLDLGPLGTADAERVNDAVAQRFAKAPVQGFVLTWRPSATDSLVFTPASEAQEFETLKAEDEAPGGCGEKSP